MKRTSTCPSCGGEAFSEDAFCSQCGTRLRPRGPETGLTRRTIVKETTATADRLACGSCNSPILAGEVFCSTCGARYTQAVSQPGQRAVRVEILHKLEDATRGRFEFIRELGRGGMGAVYLARELELERNVAIKVLSSSWLMDGSMVERFRREARTIASLRHPSIVHVHGVGRADDIHYFIMDFIDGVSLGKILLTHGPLSIPATLAILGQVGSALQYAHRPGRSVIHRDIKPGNIMVDSEGASYVTDFGISKATESQSGLTMTGLIMGTPEYMSPEQCRGDAAGPPSDQYALGAVAFAMLTGSPPYTGPHYRVLVGHTSEPLPAIADLRPDCPPKIAEAVSRMLAKSPNTRFPDIARAMSALGARATLPDDPVRDELAELVMAARRHRGDGPTPEVVSPPGTAERERPTWLRILSPPEALETGDTIDLHARKGFPDGREVENGDVLWESTDPAIAVIDPDTGRLVAVGAGTAVITASVAGVQESVAINVAPPQVVHLAIEPATLELEAGESNGVAAAPRSRADAVLEGRAVLWSSSDPGVATVSADGEITGHRPGNASILAHCEGVGASLEVVVVPARVHAVRFVDAPESMRVGETAALSADARDVRGNRIDREIAFTLAESEFARIAADGTLEALAEGRVTVDAGCEGHTASTTIRILPPPVAALVIDPPDAPVIAGESTTLQVTVSDASGQPLDREIAWKSSDRGIAEVDPRGRLSAIAPGSVHITASCEGVSSSIELDVAAVPVASIEISAAPSELVAGDTFHLIATPRDAAGGEMDRAIEWEVEDGTVIESLGGGRFRALLAGSTALIARAGSAESRQPLQVDRIRVASISLVIPKESIQVDETVELSAELRDQRSRPLDRVLTWKTSDPWIARINARGVLEGAGPGTVTVTVECEDESDSALVTVTSAPWATVVFKPDDLPARPAEESPVEGSPAQESQEDAASATPGPEGKADEAEPSVEMPTDWIGPAESVQLPRMVAQTPVPGVEPDAGRDRGRRLLWLAPVVLIAGGTAAWFALRGDGGGPDPSAVTVAAAVTITDASNGLPLPDLVDLVVGDTLRLDAQAQTADGAGVPEAPIDWTSTDPALAAIDASGTLVARAAGAVRIAAISDTLRREFDLTIAAAEPEPAAPPVANAGGEAASQPGAAAEETRVDPPVQQRETVTPPPTTSEPPDSTPPPTTQAPPDPVPDGTLQVVVSPFADIFVDGEQRATAQRGIQLDLPPGTHRMRLVNPNMVPVDTTFEIVSGQTQRLTITLRPRGS